MTIQIENKQLSEETQQQKTAITELQHSLHLARKKQELILEISKLHASLKKIDNDIRQNLNRFFGSSSTKQQRKHGPKPLTTQEKIMRLLQKNPEGLKIHELARATKRSDSHIYNSLKSLKSHNGGSHIVPLGHGRWGMHKEPALTY
jgi:hypothetical protein